MRADGAVPCGAAGARLLLKMVETLAVERSQNDGAEGSQSALMVDMVDGPRCQFEPSTIDEAARAAEGVPLTSTSAAGEH